jgi:hypothetical protein
MSDYYDLALQAAIKVAGIVFLSIYLNKSSIQGRLSQNAGQYKNTALP